MGIGLLALLLALPFQSIAQDRRCDSKTRFVFVNGGDTPTSNYIFHEQDLYGFYSNLACNPKNAAILNGGGDKTQIVDLTSTGQFARDSGERLKLFPSWLAGKKIPFQAANAASLKNAITSIPVRSRSVTMFFGDHGGASGPSLWDGAFPSGDLFKLKNRFSASTLVRSIHIHCHSGASIVPEKRVLPTTTRKLMKFLDTNYPPNRCGLGLSRGDELGQYLSYTNNYDNNYWGNLLSKTRNKSIGSIKNLLRQKANLLPSPVSTSDYLVMDLHKFIGPGKAPPAGSGCASCRTKPSTHPAPGLSQNAVNLNAALYGDTALHEKAIASLTAEYSAMHALFFEYVQIMGEWREEFVKKQFSAFYKDYLAKMAGFEKALSKKACGDKALSPAAFEDIAARKKALHAQYTAIIATTADSPAAINHLKGLAPEWLKKNSSRYPLAFKKTNPQTLLKDGLRSLHAALDAAMNENQQKRKSHFLSLVALYRKKVETWLAKPGNRKLKKRYANIIACENSRLD